MKTSNNLRDYISDNIIANQIRMSRVNDPRKTYIIVEGPSDSKFYEGLINTTFAQIIPASGRTNLCKALEVLNKAKFRGVLGIADSDFRILEKTPVSIVNLFFTDGHDLETMLLQSPSLEKILREWGSKNKIAGKDVRDLLLKAGLAIGYLRWVSVSDNLGINCKELDFSKFIGRRTLLSDLDKLIKTLVAGVQNSTIDYKNLKLQIEDCLKSNTDPWHICCGHDLVKILSLGLQKLLGSKTVEVATLERELRIGYETAYFQKTQLYAKMCEWEAANSPFRCFSTPQP